MHEMIRLDTEYKTLIKELKNKVKSTRMRVMLAVNSEQIRLYWDIGKTIIERQQKTSWGAKLLDQISADLMNAFPDMKGFSVTSLKRMRQFAECYPNFEIGAQSVPQLPWGHIILLIQKVKDDTARVWYAKQAHEHGWARDALSRWIKSDLYARQSGINQKITNFEQRLPAEQSELAQELIKEPYDLGFLPGGQNMKERDIEEGLIHNVRKFLLELGSGFAFIGSQYHLEVGGDDFYIDLLFFCIEINNYFIIELKRGKFKPEYVGKLNFYISAVDDLVKKPHHNPTIGLLLCEGKNHVVAEYALNKVENPMGISEYQLAKALPSKELLEDQLSKHNSNKKSLDEKEKIIG